MKTFTKHILLLALMLFGVAGAAWAQTHQKYTGPVAFSDIVEGDTLAPGFSITGLGVSQNLGFNGNRYKQGDALGTGDIVTNGITVTGYGGDNPVAVIISETILVTPVDESGQDGNAWVVTFASSSYVYISGIYIAPDPTVPALDELTGNWNFLMPGSNKVVKVTYKAEPALAWTYGNRAIPNDTTITAYRGFELPVIGNIGAIMDHDFLTALMGGTVSLRYGSTNPAVISFTNPNNMYSFSVNGAGECDVYMVFDGNDDFQDDSVAFHAVIANPATLTLAAQGNGTLEIAESIGTVYTITFEQSGISGDNRSFTIPASRFPYDTTFSYNANITSAYAYDQMGEGVDIFTQGDNWITVRISGPFEYGGYYSCELEGGATDDWTISCTAGTGPVPPDGIAATETENSYLVLPGTEVQVVATAQDGNYVSAWSPINKAVTNLLSDTATFTVGETMTLTATFVENPTLTLEANNSEWGTVTLDGITPGATTYNISIGGGDTYTNVTFPFTTTVFLHEGYDWVDVLEDPYPLNVEKYGDSARITISAPYNGGRTIVYEYFYNEEPWDDAKTIFCTAVPVAPIMPEGITKTGPNTYRVLPGTEVKVIATPDPAHYFVNWTGETDAISNEAVVKTLTMGTAPATLTANFQAKPTLTLNQTDGGTLEAIVPQGGAIDGNDLLGTFTGNSTTIDGIATLNPNGAEYDANTGWGIYTQNTDMTVTIAEGVNVTKVKFIGNKGGYYEDTEAPYQVTLYQYYEGFTNSAPQEDVASIEVYGYQNVAANVIASSTPNTYIIDYGTPVTVVATPDAQHYLVSFSDDAPATERNSNIAVEKRYDSVIAPINLSATFQAKPTLTLTHNNGGTLTLDGMTEPSATGTTFTVPGTWQDDNTPLTATDFPGFVPVSQEEALTWQAPASGNYRLLYKYEGGHWYYININNGTLGITGYEDLHRFNTYSIQNNGRTIVYTTGAIGGMPAGVVSANATRDTFVVDYGTTLTVTATPDSIHYLATLGGVTMGSNTAKDTTFAVTATTNLAANFAQKPTLTLAHNDGGTLEAIVPQGGVTAMHPTTDQISTWDGVLEPAMEADLQQFGFVAVDSAAAAAWTGVPASGDIMLVYATAGNQFKAILFQDGQWYAAYTSIFYKTEIYAYTNADVIYFTTGASKGNVIASSTPNTYYIDYGTPVTVVATPSDTAYLVRFDQDDDTNSNTAVEKTYGPLTAALTTAEATFNDKPVLTLAANDTTWGKVSVDGVVEPSTTGIIFNVPNEWNGDNTTNLSAGDFPGFVSISEEEALNWQAPASGIYWLFYKFEGESGHYLVFYNGAYFSKKSNTISHGDYYYQQNYGAGTNIAYTTGAIPGGMPAGVAKLTDSTYRVDYGTEVTLIADATELHHVANWVDADSAAYPADRITYSAYFVTEPVALFPDSSTLTLTITADTTAKAVFGINSYDVFATAQLDDRDEIGTGTAMGYLNVSYKDIVGTTQTAGPEDTLDYTAQGGSLSTITSTSYYGYRFSGWYDADMDTLMSSVNPQTLTEAAVVEARYTPINYTVTGLSEDDEMGTVTGGGTLPYRTPVSLTAVPERGYHFTGWDNGLSANPLELAAMSDFTVTASFAPNQYTVTVLSGDETMGSASGSTVADFHTTVTLTATPNAHYHFVAWSNGVTDTVTELLVDGDTTVTALFAADEYTITGLSADSTMGSVSGSATVTYPATVTLTATAANCHHFVQWNDGVTANPRTVNALEDLTLTATFAASTYASSEDVTTCDSYTWNNVTYTASGTYTYSTTTLAGCDSTATLHLTLITGIETEEVVEACESYEWHGVVYTQSTGILGAPTYTTTAHNGCDSTVTLRLTINHGTTAVETVEACDSYTWNGRTYFSSTTTATYTTEGSNGCDSTTTLHLTLGRSTSGELNVEACESYTWHGVTYTESIVGPTDTNLNTSGCPHVTTLHLTILRNSSSEETVEACDVYNWHGVNRYASGDYVFLSPNAVGCDSTAILHLTILRSTHAEEIAAACDEYEWHGILFTESADTTLHTLNAAGCDSAMTLHLTLYYNSEATDVVTACDSYTWIDGVTYTASTDEPTYTLAGANCSTTVTLNLTVNYSTAGIDEQEAVDSYTWINGITYTASTDQPTFVLTNAAGCDSVVTLHLTITYTPEPVYYNVTLATADATMGSVAPAGTTVIEEGLSFTATATALTGRHFVAWVSNGTVVSNANPYTFVVNDDVELTATFDYDEVIAVLTVNDETMGTTTPAPGTYTFHVGDEATVTATANEHYHFVGWTVNGTPINTQETTYTVTVTPEMAGTTFYVEAVFAQNEGIDDNEGILEATVYAQEGQIVVEGAGNSTVVLYDVTGRRLAVKHSDNAPLRFDIAVSGTYLVKVGNAPAKRIVMVR